MSRTHLVEFEDLGWFPRSIRNYMTDYLQFVANKYNMYESIVPIIEKGVKASGEKRIIDLASGGGGGWEQLSKHVHQNLPDVKIVLTDFYPNHDALSGLCRLKPEIFSYSKESISALDVPNDLKGLRTQFLSFHHFRPKDAQQILQNAVDSGQPIAIFEAQKNSIGDFIKFFFSPINVLAFTPFIKPFSFGRIFFTYLFPLVPLFTWWDGLASVLRTYSVDEQRQLIHQLKNGDSYNWEIGEAKKGMFTIYYLLGTKVG